MGAFTITVALGIALALAGIFIEWVRQGRPVVVSGCFSC